MKLSKKLILASKSPRRKEILTQAGIDFEIRTLETEEIYPEDMPLQQVPEYLAKLKANALKHTLADDEVILSADTIVLLKNTIFGKPKDFDDFFRILKTIINKEFRFNGQALYAMLQAIKEAAVQGDVDFTKARSWLELGYLINATTAKFIRQEYNVWVALKST